MSLDSYCISYLITGHNIRVFVLMVVVTFRKRRSCLFLPSRKQQNDMFLVFYFPQVGVYSYPQSFKCDLGYTVCKRTPWFALCEMSFWSRRATQSRSQIRWTPHGGMTLRCLNNNAAFYRNKPTG